MTLSEIEAVSEVLDRLAREPIGANDLCRSWVLTAAVRRNVFRRERPIVAPYCHDQWPAMAGGEEFRHA